MIVVSVEAVREAYAASHPNTISVSEVLDFIDYCISFYGHDGVYPYGFHFSEICEGMVELFKTRPSIPFEGDSVDRENVRDIVLLAREKENLECA